jgi:hypothetical protein
MSTVTNLALQGEVVGCASKCRAAVRCRCLAQIKFVHGAILLSVSRSSGKILVHPVSLAAPSLDTVRLAAPSSRHSRLRAPHLKASLPQDLTRKPALKLIEGSKVFLHAFVAKPSAR